MIWTMRRIIMMKKKWFGGVGSLVALATVSLPSWAQEATRAPSEAR